MEEDLLYLRKSRDKAEIADPDVLHKHRSEILRLVGRPVPPENIYEEIGSGDTLRARPLCRRLLERIDRLPRHAGGRLWTLEVARLTRGHLHDRARVQDCLQRAAVIHCTRDSRYDLNRTNDRLQWEVLTMMAAHELGTYRDRVEAARIEIALDGQPQTGTVPMGWWWDRNARSADGRRGRIQTDPVVFPIVQALCRDALHESCAALAVRFGLPEWRIWYTLRHPFICGYPCKRHFVHGGEKRRRDAGEWTRPRTGERMRAEAGEEWLNASARAPADRWIWPRQAGDYEPACTRSEWEAIQQAIDARRARPTHTGAADGWCRDVVRFTGYESVPARLSSQNATGGKRATYELSRPKGAAGLSHLYVWREDAHAAALAALAGLFADPGVLQRGADRYLAQRRPDGASNTAALTAEVAKLEQLLDALLDRELRAAADGDAREAASCARQRDQYKRDLAAAEAALQSLSRQCGVDPAVEDVLRLLQQIDPSVLLGAWGQLADPQRQIVVAGLVESVPCRVYRLAGETRWRREVGPARLKPLFIGATEHGG